MNARRLTIFSWVALAYTVLVILWGAFVRATGSGAGCGSHWPLCNGTVLQRAPSLETMIELSHRITSGLALVIVVALTVAVFRSFPRGHAARHGAALSTIFLLLEAAIGAGLVLLELVADNDSSLRAVAIALHLVNTFLLLGVQTYTAIAVTTDRRERFRPAAGGARLAAVLGGLVLFLTVGASGAIVALGDTLFPAATLAEGVRQHLSDTAHFLIRLRVLHPALAVASALYLILLGAGLRARDPRPATVRATRLVTALVGLQVVLGVVNLLLLAPVWMQLVHLAVADTLWIALIALSIQTLSAPAAVHAGAEQGESARRLRLVTAR